MIYNNHLYLSLSSLFASGKLKNNILCKVHLSKPQHSNKKSQCLYILTLALNVYQLILFYRCL